MGVTDWQKADISRRAAHALDAKELRTDPLPSLKIVTV